MLEELSMYTDEFRNDFNDSKFYANPKQTKIHLIIDGKEHIIGNSTVFSVERSNEKIPVYAYNSSLYAKYLNGKSVITGYIQLRKTTIDRILSMLKTNVKEDEYNRRLAELNESIENLDLLSKFDETNFNDQSINEFLNAKIMVRNELLNNKEKWFAEDSGLGDLSDDTNDLLFLRDFKSVSNIQFKLVFDSYMNDVVESIQDILFVKKIQDVNISENDIMEIYQFIGNPKKHLE